MERIDVDKLAVLLRKYSQLNFRQSSAHTLTINDDIKVMIKHHRLIVFGHQLRHGGNVARVLKILIRVGLLDITLQKRALLLYHYQKEQNETV